MPVYHLTIHAYASWMPDRPGGSYHPSRGYQPTDEAWDHLYRDHQREPSAEFGDDVQQVLVNAVLAASKHQRLLCYAIATDRSHLHVLCGCREERSGPHVRNRLTRALSIVLRERIERRTWFSRRGAYKRVRTAEHFAELFDLYLPDHHGWKWNRDRGCWR